MDMNLQMFTFKIAVTMYSHIRVTIGLQTPFAKALALKENILFKNHRKVCTGHNYNIVVTEL